MAVLSPRRKPWTIPAQNARRRAWIDARAQPSHKFKQAAREAECDEDEARWDERLSKIARQKPVEKPKT